MDKNELLILVPEHGFFYKYISELGYQVCDPFYNNKIIFRLLREFFFRLKLPGRSLWYNKEVISEKKYIILYEPLLTADYIKWVYFKNANSKLILFYANPVKTSISPDTIDRSMIELVTSDKDDAKKYNMHLYEGGGYFPQWKVKKVKPEYDVFYVGKDKNRLQKLRDIESDLQLHGAKTLFYITWERGWQHKDDGIHKPFLPYEGVLDYIGKSRAILHLLDGAQNGITLRIQESLIHKVKLITDDKNIIAYDFYTPNNIFILGKDDLNGLRDFLDTPYEDVESDFFKHAFYDQMIEEVISYSIDKTNLKAGNK